MSHIVTVTTLVRDVHALAAACRRLGLRAPVQGTAQLFASAASGQIVHLPGWTFPLAIDTTSGQIFFDNYNGAWGEQRQLDRLLQAYAVEKARLEARKQGHSVTEQTLSDGSIKLLISVGGGA
jgi:ABC-type branched-subunit amino acid transport system substrate-binding protein